MSSAFEPNKQRCPARLNCEKRLGAFFKPSSSTENPRGGPWPTAEGASQDDRLLLLRGLPEGARTVSGDEELEQVQGFEARDKGVKSVCLLSLTTYRAPLVKFPSPAN
jgi:hypothetical protein